MRKIKADNRSRLLQAALEVSYRYGFGASTLADIAKQARVPLGNVYYYFKTKDEIGDAIIDMRLSRLRALLEELDRLESPRDRLCGFVQLKVERREALARAGCPVGTLCSELQKQGGPVANRSTIVFAEALAWLERQFKALGKGADSRGLAVHLLSATQGVSVLAHTFHDPGLIDIEAARLKQWICNLETQTIDEADAIL
ncbi:MAG TPA: TetR/AcrR family transcriptional regulator [Blastocatellia bacterium]|nr:TetR/AcrR family transcriptional regulator [Blastocatellia bacterium]